jgi:hypothetical protein
VGYAQEAVGQILSERIVGTDMALGHTIPADKFSYLGGANINVLDPNPDPRSKVTLGNEKSKEIF